LDNIKAIAEIIKEYVAKALEPISAGLDRLSKNVDAAHSRADRVELDVKSVLEQVQNIPAPLTLDDILKNIPVAEQIDIETLKADILKAVPAHQVIDVETIKADILKAIPVAEAVDIDAILKAVPAPQVIDIEALKADILKDIPPQVALDDIVKALPTPPAPEHGKDALDIDILPGIDFEKSYLRGTYATHDGGLWKAHSNTQGARGWECIVKGVKGVTCDFDGERSIKLNVEMTGGDIIERGFSVPVMIYRNVWTERTYEKGDTVTWAGSLWHCDEPTDLKPGEGKGWTLATKRGRDGKDAKPVVDTSGGVKI